MVFTEKYSIIMDDETLISIFKNNRPCEVASKIMKYYRRYDNTINFKEFKFVRLRDGKIYHYCAWSKELTLEELVKRPGFNGYQVKFKIHVKQL